jgi:hypothetical protein
MPLIETIKQKFTARARADVATYRELLEAILDDRDHGETEAIAAMHDADKKPEDLDIDVERLRQRRKWDAQIDDARLAQQEHESALSELARLGPLREQLIKDAVRDIDRQVADQRAIAHKAEGRRYADRMAERKLIDGASPELYVRKAKLQRERSSVIESIDVVEEHIVSVKRSIATRAAEIEGLKKQHVPGDPSRFHPSIAGPLKKHKADVTGLQKQIPEIERRLVEKRKVVAQFDEQLAAVHAEMLKP